MLSNYSAEQILKALCGKSSAATLSGSGGAFLALSQTEPTVAGGNVTEPSGGGYERVLVGNANQALTQLLGNVSNKAITNTATIFFPEATASWGTLTHVCIYSAKTGGNLLAYGALQTAITPTVNTVPLLRVGDLDISLT